MTFQNVRIPTQVASFHRDYLLYQSPLSSSALFIPEQVVTVNEGQILLSIANLTSAPIKVSRTQALFVMEPFFEGTNQPTSEIVHAIRPPANENLSEDAFLPSQLRYEEFLSLVDEKLAHLPSEQREVLRPILLKYFSPPGTFEATPKFTASIDTKGQTSFSHPFPIPFAYRRPLDNLLQFMMDNGILEKSTSSVFNSPCFIIRKPEGGFRFVIDNRQLNLITEPRFFPLTSISESINKLHGKKFISCFDITSSFWAIPLDEQSSEATTFQIPHTGKQYKFKRLNFGLKNSSYQFSKAMSVILANFTEMSFFLWTTSLFFLLIFKRTAKILTKS